MGTIWYHLVPIICKPGDKMRKNRMFLYITSLNICINWRMNNRLEMVEWHLDWHSKLIPLVSWSKFGTYGFLSAPNLGVK